MAGLNTSLSIATEALQAQEAAISVTSNNIANANTVGYTRETVVLTESASYQDGMTTLGGGVTLQGFSSVRDQLLDLRIQQQTSQQSSADAQTASLNQVQSLFSSSGNDLGTDLSSFFSSVSALTANADDTATRQAVLSAGQNVAEEFNTLSSGLTSEQTSLDQQVGSDVDQINHLSSQIASLNTQLGQASAQGQNTGPLQDQVAADELSLSKLTSISVTHTEGTDTITTGNGTPLVLGNQSFALKTTAGSNGLQQVLDSSGNNITSTLTGGDLGGTIQTRDSLISGLLTQLDTLANQFATSVNSAQSSGYNQNGTSGAALFSVPSTVTGSAAAITLAASDPSAIAASSESSGDGNGNVQNLSAVATTKLPSGLTPTNSYASLVYNVGTLTSNASNESSAIGVSLTQLNQQQSSTSGVSIDEESANLIQYQQAYQAAARVISTLSTLFNTTISMVGG